MNSGMEPEEMTENAGNDHENPDSESLNSESLNSEDSNSLEDVETTDHSDQSMGMDAGYNQILSAKIREFQSAINRRKDFQEKLKSVTLRPTQQVLLESVLATVLDQMNVEKTGSNDEYTLDFELVREMAISNLNDLSDLFNSDEVRGLTNIEKSMIQNLIHSTLDAVKIGFVSEPVPGLDLPQYGKDVVPASSGLFNWNHVFETQMTTGSVYPLSELSVPTGFWILSAMTSGFKGLKFYGHRYGGVSGGQSALFIKDNTDLEMMLDSYIESATEYSLDERLDNREDEGIVEFQVSILAPFLSVTEKLADNLRASEANTDEQCGEQLREESRVDWSGVRTESILIADLIPLVLATLGTRPETKNLLSGEYSVKDHLSLLLDMAPSFYHTQGVEYNWRLDRRNRPTLEISTTDC